MAKKGGKRPASGPTKGERTREEIVTRALYMAAQDGLGTLSIGKLAKELEMSKSSLFVYFGSKENLETAVVERAGVLFFDHVLVPIEEDGLEGIERVWALCDLWLKFVEDRVFPGGYFFTGAYLQCAGQRGSIPSQIREIARHWITTLKEAVDRARRRGEVHLTVDAQGTALELNALLLGAQWSQLMEYRDRTQARSAIIAKLASLATKEIPAGVFDSERAWRKYLESRLQ